MSTEVKVPTLPESVSDAIHESAVDRLRDPASQVDYDYDHHFPHEEFKIRCALYVTRDCISQTCRCDRLQNRACNDRHANNNERRPLPTEVDQEASDRFTEVLRLFDAAASPTGSPNRATTVSGASAAGTLRAA